MSAFTISTASLGYQPADTTIAITNIRFIDGPGRNGFSDSASSGLQEVLLR